MSDIFWQMIRKKSLRTISGKETDSLFYITLHRIRSSIVANISKRFFIDIKETIGSRKCLDKILIFQYFIQIQRVYPLGVKSSKHLINNYQEIKLFILGYPYVWMFMRKSGGHILLEPCISANIKMLFIGAIIIFQHFPKPVFFHNGPISTGIIDSWIK